MSKYSDVKKIILENFKETKIKSIKEFPEGYNNVAYDVRLKDGDYVIKIIKLKGFETYVLKQNKLRTLIRKKFKDFPITRIIKSDYTKKLIDRPYIIAEKLDGNSLRSSYKKINNKEEIFEEIGELYGKLHSFKMKSYGELLPSLKLIKTYKSWYNENCKKVKKIFIKIEENKLLSNNALKKNKSFFDKNKYYLKKEIGPRLCHGDASLTNILVKKAGNKHVVSGIIDFEFCRSSGITQELFSGLRKPDRKYEYKDSLVKGYSRYNKLPKEWEQLLCIYKWISSLDRLTQIKGMSWRNLDKKRTDERKKNLRRESLQNLRNMEKRLEILTKSV
ncbi:aminoglycoside phosphotransferase family protein [Candidatus Woesearchaeota archaeon]|jgi:Ser/Thr protein kinase RdoA (MazF antagonist)|nr:aminoglycoside phosphotransferase family protein [Candidatus Woesearchaeota archaeon]MBT4058529.1 aminoglycoside phosphotransferase family protein [Candidatus Woesearchaeota archaeon]MBT4208701.1 aminoglycoside phosphotransferase family protein [Candidatus Woesearchaeota archaeon]MBT4730691.1 aminoglycoside phosphotransferase family protein [Candidatus Woesearchaeota archaeon]MBT4783244.1 aminoglycoside phosphotransferase family protein [Candidatus Woesearchaeota archaeon]